MLDSVCLSQDKLDYPSITNNPKISVVGTMVVCLVFFFSLMLCIQYGLVPTLTAASSIVSPTPPPLQWEGRVAFFRKCILQDAQLWRGQTRAT